MQVSQTVSDARSALSRLAGLKAESERAKESLTIGEKSLVLAKARAKDASALLNPLNHPRVKELLGGKK
jgi:hypothetical protein